MKKDDVQLFQEQKLYWQKKKGRLLTEQEKNDIYLGVLGQIFMEETDGVRLK